MRASVVILLLALLPLSARAESEIVTFPMEEFSGETTMLQAKLTVPDGEGPFPAVVLLHGCNGTDLQGTWDNYTRISSWGYVTLRIDSFGPRGIDNLCTLSPDMSRASPATRARDAHAGREFLASLPYVDGDRIAVVGWSHGGITVMKAISNISKYEPRTTTPFNAAVAFYPWCDLTRGLDAPLLVLIGEADDWTRAWNCETMELPDATQSFELVVYPGATHAFDWEGEDLVYLGHKLSYDPEAAADAYRRLEAFLALHLQAP